MEVSPWFIGAFFLLWMAGPLTQILHLIAPKLHYRLGLMEADAYKPEFKWYLLEEKAIAIADMTYLAAGAAFIALALLGNDIALLFGLYTCACYVYFAATYIPRTVLLSRHDLSPVSKKQLGGYLAYACLYLLFGLYGLFYLWGLVQP